MKKLFSCLAAVVLCAAMVLGAFAQNDYEVHRFCVYCGMDREEYAYSRMMIEYKGAPDVGTCSIHCTACEIAAHREKKLARMVVSDYDTKALIDAREAVWVIGGDKVGVMTKRAKWAFAEEDRALRFIREHGGRRGTLADAMKATFDDMYEDIRAIQERRKAADSVLSDVRYHPECKYCGMDRRRYAYSRMLVEYHGGTAVGTCSIHCTALDLALNPDKMAKAILVGDFETKKLIDAEKAIWVIGGDKTGVMSIRGKWAFDEKSRAEDFIRKHGGSLGTYDEAMKTTFEDMYEILR